MSRINIEPVGSPTGLSHNLGQSRTSQPDTHAISSVLPYVLTMLLDSTFVCSPLLGISVDDRSAGEEGLIAATICPAERRTQRIQNIDLALLALEDQGCQLGVTADDIANGARDKTLELVWIFASEMQVCGAPTRSSTVCCTSFSVC